MTWADLVKKIDELPSDIYHNDEVELLCNGNYYPVKELFSDVNEQVIVGDNPV